MLFLNAPVQNGEFTLTELPGKATGIRIATALNKIMGTPPCLRPGPTPTARSPSWPSGSFSVDCPPAGCGSVARRCGSVPIADT